jgi:RluA family pseudouridine synthase
MTDLERLERALTTERHEWRYLDPGTCPATVVAALKLELPETPLEEIAAQLKEGAVHLNGIRIEADLPLTPPVKLEYFAPKGGTPGELRFDEGWVVFEDPDLLAVVKPAGLTAMPARDQRYRNLKTLIETRVGGPIHMPSRLDTSTAGIVVVSKTTVMHPRLQHIFERRRVEKMYLAELSGDPNFAELTVENLIGRDPAHQVLRQVVTTGGKQAITRFRSVRRRVFQTTDAATTWGTLVEAYPLTGRTHQIRVHAAHLGTPLIGDNFYGGYESPTLHLLAYRLTFPHPLTGVLLHLEVPPHLTPAWAS